LCVSIVGDRARHLTVTALDQNIGQRLTDPETRRHGEQMCLALVFGDVRKVGISEPCLFQDRTGNCDVIVLGKSTDYTGWCVGNWCDPARELSQRLSLDFLNQAADDIVKKPDVFYVEAGSAVEKQARNAAQCLRSFFR